MGLCVMAQVVCPGSWPCPEASLCFYSWRNSICFLLWKPRLMYDLEFQFGTSLGGVLGTVLFPFIGWFWCINQLYLHSPFSIVGSHILIGIKTLHKCSYIWRRSYMKNTKFAIMVISEEEGKWWEFWTMWRRASTLYFIAKYKDT